ncbi:MAG: hypothetical protein AB9856_20935 [Cellulosilyticaceae bacterium]
MVSSFIKYNKMILERSNLYLEYNEAEDEELIKCENGEKRIYTKGCLSPRPITIGGGTINFREQPILAIPCIFGIFDMYIDLKYPTVQGKNFKVKHDFIPMDTNISIMEKSFYRIFKIIRNATTHNQNAIQSNNNLNIIDYNHLGTRFYLKISDEILIQLYEAVVLLMDDELNKTRGDKFKEGILLYYYNNIVQNIRIRDDIHEFLGLKDNVLSINPFRVIIKNPEYKIKDDIIEIENAKYKPDHRRDFLIEYNNSCYIVPQEALFNCTINIEDLNNWKASAEYLSRK